MAAPRQPGPLPYEFRRSGRSRGTAALVALIWLALIAAWLWLEAALWVVGLLALFTLPACWDLLRNPAAGLTLDNTTLSWFTGPRDAQIALSEIDHMRLDTRLDFSVRATALLKSGRRIRLPFESTPPHRAFEQALEAAGLRVRRTHFQLRQ